MDEAAPRTITGLAEPEEMPALLVTNRFLPVLRRAAGAGTAVHRRGREPEEPAHVDADRWLLARRASVETAAVIGRRITVDGNAPRSDRRSAAKGSSSWTARYLLVMPLRLNRAKVPLLNFSYQGIARHEAGRNAGAGECRYRAHAANGAAKIPDEPRLQREDVLDARIRATCGR